MRLGPVFQVAKAIVYFIIRDGFMELSRCGFKQQGLQLCEDLAQDFKLEVVKRESRI